jgi:hypothetical protein
VVECLLSMDKTLGSISSTGKKKRYPYEFKITHLSQRPASNLFWVWLKELINSWKEAAQSLPDPSGCEVAADDFGSCPPPFHRVCSNNARPKPGLYSRAPVWGTSCSRTPIVGEVRPKLPCPCSALSPCFPGPFCLPGFTWRTPAVRK